MAAEKTAVVLARLDERLNGLIQDVTEIKLDTKDIKTETRKTNGRVTTLETKVKVVEDVEPRVRELENNKNFLKGSWKTIAVGGASAATLVGIIELVKYFI